MYNFADYRHGNVQVNRKTSSTPLKWCPRYPPELPRTSKSDLWTHLWTFQKQWFRSRRPRKKAFGSYLKPKSCSLSSCWRQRESQDKFKISQMIPNEPPRAPESILKGPVGHRCAASRQDNEHVVFNASTVKRNYHLNDKISRGGKRNARSCAPTKRGRRNGVASRIYVSTWRFMESQSYRCHRFPLRYEHCLDFYICCLTH